MLVLLLCGGPCTRLPNPSTKPRQVEILAPPQPAASTSSSSSSPPGAASTPARANICIGLASRGFPLHRHPGTSPYNGGGTGPTPVLMEAGDETTGVCASYAYRGSDGRVQAHVSHYPLHPNRKGGGGSSSPATPSIALSVRGKEYGPGFAPGDVVGCGLDFTTQEASVRLMGGRLVDQARAWHSHLGPSPHTHTRTRASDLLHQERAAPGPRLPRCVSPRLPILPLD